MSKILLFIILFLLCLSSVTASTMTRYGSDFKIVSNEISFKINDRLGSDRLILDDNSIIAESNNLPYGQQLKNNNIKFSFTGKELDNTNNYYFNARYYDFDSGKFLGVDPVSDNHAYAFVSNNPMNMVDPSGRDPFDGEEDEYWENVLAGYIETKWYDMIRGDISEINSVSESVSVPAEAMLSAILVEDIRFFAPSNKDVLTASYLKGLARSATPNWVLELAGHRSNAEPGKSNQGMVWEATFVGAVKYLETVDGLDEGTKSLLSKAPSSDSFSNYGSFYMRVCSSFSDIEKVALTLKAHMVFWEENGYDLFDYDFKTVDSFGERVGVLETLNSIFEYNYKDLINSHTYEQVPKGFTTDFGRNYNTGRAHSTPDRHCVPHDSPGLGGTVLWDSMSYGDISRIFVDSGLATQIMESGVGSSIATSDIPDQ